MWKHQIPWMISIVRVKLTILGMIIPIYQDGNFGDIPPHFPDKATEQVSISCQVQAEKHSCTAHGGFSAE